LQPLVADAFPDPGRLHQGHAWEGTRCSKHRLLLVAQDDMVHGRRQALHNLPLVLNCKEHIRQLLPSQVFELRMGGAAHLSGR
jgi:hypothetical protein